MNRFYLFSMYANTSGADQPLVSHSEAEKSELKLVSHSEAEQSGLKLVSHSEIEQSGFIVF